MNMRKYWLGILIIMGLLSLSPKGKAEEGPELKFQPESESSESQKSKDPYGSKPLLKFGNDHQYFKLGGYGSMRFEADTASGLNDTFTLRRVVMTTDALIASRFRIYTELEFERFRKVELQSNVVQEN